MQQHEAGYLGLPEASRQSGEREGLQVRSAPAVSRGNVNVIIPDKLYQRGHMLTWTAAQKRALLDGYGIDVVVNLWLKVDPDLSGMIYLNWPIAGNERPPDQKIIVVTTAALLRRGHRVLIHCEAGVNRSVWLCAQVVAAYLSIPEEDAWHRVEEAVGRVKVHAGLRTGQGG